MAFGEIKINTKEAESKLKIFHKHIGNMLEEFKTVCSNCGSTDTNVIKVCGDGEVVEEVRECKDCESLV